MYGAIIGDLIGFPYEYKHVDLTDRSIPLLEETPSSAASGGGTGAAQAGEVFSDKTVLTAAIGAGILEFERGLPSLFSKDGGKGEGGRITVGGTNAPGTHIPQNAFEDSYKKELTTALRRFGQNYPLAGYAMDLSIWLFREDAGQVQTEDPGPAARVVPVAWSFQDDLYMMRHMARVQAALTHKSRESVQAAEAEACAVFLAIHGSTKPYIAQYLEREFGYKTSDEKTMREELLRAGGARRFSGTGGADTASGSGDAAKGTSLPALYVRAAMTAFLNGRDFEDVMRRAVSLGGSSSDLCALAGGIAEAFFGIPEELREECLRRLPEDVRAAADAFAAREAQKKAARDSNPAAKSRWENALTRASSRHPAAVQGNEPIEKAIDVMREKRDQQSLITLLELLRHRMNNKGRVFVPLVSAKRAEKVESAEAGNAQGKPGVSGNGSSENGTMQNGTMQNGSPQNGGAENGMVYSMQVIRTKDGRLWQPAYTSREQLDKANAALAKAGTAAGNAAPDNNMVLSYALDALFMRFLPLPEGAAGDTQIQGGQDSPAVKETVPAQIQGIVFNPYDKAFFVPRKTIESIFVINKEAIKAEKARAEQGEKS